MAEAITDDAVKRYFDAGLQAQPAGPAPVPPVRQRRTVDSAIRQRLVRFDPAGDPVELDTTEGAPLLTRLNLAFAPDDTTRQALLQRSFAGSTIDPAQFYPGGPTQFVIRNYTDPQTGRVKDLLVDETDITFKDFADLGQIGVEILGAFAAMRGGRPLTGQVQPGIFRTGAEAVTAGVGANVVGAATDVAARQQAGVPIQPGEVAARRGLQTGIDVAADIGLAGVPALAEMRTRQLARGIPQTPAAKAALEAQQQLAGQTGIEVPLTLGQRTGSKGVQQMEAFLENATIGGGPLARARARTTEELNRLESALVGNQTPLPDKDTLGGQAVRALRQVVEQTTGATTAARTTALDNAVQLLHQAIESETNLGARQVLGREAGNAITGFIGLKKEALNEVEDRLASEVDRLIGTQPFIPTPKLKQDVTRIVREAYEKPAKPGELMTSMPSTLKPILADITELGGAADLAGMRRIRRSINRQISQGQILGDTDTAVLKQLSQAVTESIRRGTQGLAPDAANALKRYNQFYKEGIEGFEVKGVTELLADPTQRKIGPSSVFRAALASEDQYFRLKDALTKPLTLEGQPVGPAATGNLTWSMFKQAALNEALDEARIRGSGQLIDANKFLEAVSSKRLGAEVRRDLLGAGADTADTALARLVHLQNPKLNADDVLDILRRGGDTAATDIEQLALREAEQAALYRNQVIRRFVKGEVGSESIQPGDFIDRYLDIAPAPELRDVMNRINSVDPALADTIRQKTTANIFQKARKNPFEDVPSALKLAKEVRNPEMQSRLESVLGRTRLNNINDFMDLLGGVAPATEQASRVTGGLAGGTQRRHLLLLNLGKLLPTQFAFAAVGNILANPRLYRVVTGPVQPVDPSQAIRRLMLEEDFLAGMYKEFKGETRTALQEMEAAVTRADLTQDQPTEDQTKTYFDRALQPAR